MATREISDKIILREYLRIHAQGFLSPTRPDGEISPSATMLAMAKAEVGEPDIIDVLRHLVREHPAFIAALIDNAGSAPPHFEGSFKQTSIAYLTVLAITPPTDTESLTAVELALTSRTDEEVLLVKPGVPHAELIAARKSLWKRFHPDVAGDENQLLACILIQRINVAYEALARQHKIPAVNAPSGPPINFKITPTEVRFAPEISVIIHGIGEFSTRYLPDALASAVHYAALETHPLMPEQTIALYQEAPNAVQQARVDNLMTTNAPDLGEFKKAIDHFLAGDRSNPEYNLFRFLKIVEKQPYIASHAGADVLNLIAAINPEEYNSYNSNVGVAYGRLLAAAVHIKMPLDVLALRLEREETPGSLDRLREAAVGLIGRYIEGGTLADQIRKLPLNNIRTLLSALVRTRDDGDQWSRDYWSSVTPILNEHSHLLRRNDITFLSSTLIQDGGLAEDHGKAGWSRVADLIIAHPITPIKFQHGFWDAVKDAANRLPGDDDAPIDSVGIGVAEILYRLRLASPASSFDSDTKWGLAQIAGHDDILKAAIESTWDSIDHLVTAANATGRPGWLDPSTTSTVGRENAPRTHTTDSRAELERRADICAALISLVPGHLTTFLAEKRDVPRSDKARAALDDVLNIIAGCAKYYQAHPPVLDLPNRPTEGRFSDTPSRDPS